MSNPNDPKQPTPPQQPDPNAQPQPDAPEGAYRSGGSSFEFQLPDEVGSYSELPPIPEPDAGDSGIRSALPPKPDAAPRTGASFDSRGGPGSRGSFGDFGLAPIPPVPTDDEPLVPDLAPGAGDSALLDLPAEPISTFGMDATGLPDVSSLYPPAGPASGALPEIPSPSGELQTGLGLGSNFDIFLPENPTAPITGDSFVGFGGPSPVLPEGSGPDLAPPGAAPTRLSAGNGDSFEDSSDLPMADDASGMFDSVEFPLAEADPSSLILRSGKAPTSPESGSTSDAINTAAPPPAGEGDSTVALDALVPTTEPSSFTLGSVELPVAEPVTSVPLDRMKAGSSGSVPDVASLAPPAGSSGSTPSLPTTPRQHGGSSFEFKLPDEVGSYSDLPPVPSPDSGDSSSTHGALPPKPLARPVDASFDFINLPSSRSLADIKAEARVIAPVEPSEPADAPPAAPVPDSKVSLGNLEPVDPVAPVSGWLDSDVSADQAPVPTADLLDVPVADLAESSDIFSGPAVKPAEPVETSDVLSATGGRESPPSGSTVADGDFSDLPVADEFGDSATALLDGGGDVESIHDAPELVSDNPLFDSSTLADAPDLPADPGADAADYGASPVYSSDASSILADMAEPSRREGDSSSVRVEAPGLDRTLAGGPSDGSFDLTVTDEPVPAGLFDEPADGTSPESNNWEDQSGSDLIAPGSNTAPEFDLNDLIEPRDANPDSGPPSLSSATSSIFSGTKVPTGSGSTSDEPAEDLSDAAEFTDHPALEETVARPKLPSEAPRKRIPNLSSADFELPTFPAAPASRASNQSEDEGAVDWDDAALAGDEHATRGVPRDASLSAILRGELPDDSSELPTKNTNPLARELIDSTSEPEVSVDWLAGSAEGPAAVDPLPLQPSAKPKGKDKNKGKKDAPAPAPVKVKPRKDDAELKSDESGTAEKVRPAKKGGVLVGLLVGGLVAGGAFAGVYLSGAIPNSEKSKTQAQTPVPGADGKVTINGQEYVLAKGGPQVPPTATATDPQTAFAAGDTAKALEHFKASPPANTADKAAAGNIRVFAKIQALKDGDTIAADDAELKTAREELEAVLADVPALAEPGGVKRAVKAAVALGVSHEVAGDTKAARKVYTDAMGAYPAYRSTFEALIDKLNALEAPVAAPGTSRRLDPADAERLLFAVVVLLQDGPKDEDPEPGVFYWKAVNLAAGGKYIEAVKQIEEAKKAHAARAKAFAGRGLNPLSDPREQIFTRSCDELKAYWELRGAIYGNPALAAAVKKDGLAKAFEKLLSAEKEATAALATVKKLEVEVAKLDKEAKASEKGKTEAEEKLKTTAADLTTAQKKFDAAMAELKLAEKDVKDQKDVLAALVETLKPVTPIPDKWAAADLIAATKAVASRATGPDLKTLVPSTMVAVGGGLAAGQLLEIAERITKAEAAAKVATTKLEAETKRLTEKYDTDTKKLRDDGAAELKKLTDTYASDTKKLNDDHAAAVKKLKDGSAEDLKKLTDKYTLDAKKLTDDYTAAAGKLKAAHEVALKEEQARTEAEKKRAAQREIEFQKQLVNAVTPGQVMDIWLPVLTDLRRPSDSAPALAAAEKAITGSVPESEDAAKARTVAGMAYLVKGDLVNAKEMFEAARRSPAYKTATGKLWPRAADEGLDAITDPLAPYRRPVVVPLIDLRAAAASLDVGISAYKIGHYDLAVKALQDAAKNDPTDPIAWYFLGAARWAKGDEEQAKKDISQGAEREKASTLPNRTLSDALTPIQGATRDAIDRKRP